MVRQAHHERNQPLTVRPEHVEGLVQSFLNYIYRWERVRDQEIKCLACRKAVGGVFNDLK